MSSLVLTVCLALLAPQPVTGPPAAPAERDRALVFVSGLTYVVNAERPRVNRRTLGDVSREIRGVPAEPVDSFVWDGVGSTPVPGRLSLSLDPVQDLGRVDASWSDEHGTWTLTQRFFAPPGHPAGVRVGKSVDRREALDDGVVHNVFLFGDSGAGGPVLPTLFSHLAAYGPAEVTLDGEPFVNPFDGSGAWSGRTIVSEGAREPDGTVRALGDVLFDPSRADRGRVDAGDLEVHVMFHDLPLPMSQNVPSEFEFFYHVVFEDVTIDLLQYDRRTPPLPFEGETPTALETATDAALPARYQVVARSPRRNRRVMGPVIVKVQGVPAEPVDSFNWNGDGSTPIEGDLLLEVIPDLELGIIQASWTDEHGDWTYLQTRFIHPEHSSGVRIGPSAAEILSLLNEGITQNVYLHGDTTAGQPILPTLFNHIATWGPADVTLNGEPFLNPFELPAPQWIGHLMLTEGVRNPDGTVRASDGSIYTPMKLTDGAVQTGDLEVHLVFHDERFPRNTNIPPIFAFFYHLVFEDVSVRIIQEDL